MTPLIGTVGRLGIAAATLATTLGVSAPASAQEWNGYRRFESPYARFEHERRARWRRHRFLESRLGYRPYVQPYAAAPRYYYGY